MNKFIITTIVLGFLINNSFSQCGRFAIGMDTTEFKEWIGSSEFKEHIIDFNTSHYSKRKFKTNHNGIPVDEIVYVSVRKERNSKTHELFNFRLFEGKVIGGYFCYKTLNDLEKRLHYLKTCESWKNISSTKWVNEKLKLKLEIEESTKEYRERLKENAWSHFVSLTSL